MKRQTYPRLSVFTHPESDNNSLFTPPQHLIPTDDDIALAEEIIELYEKCGKKDVGGEWKYIDSNKRYLYVQSLRLKDKYALAELLCNFFINSCSYGIITPSLSEITFQTKEMVLCDIDAAIEFAGLDTLEKISKEKYAVGNPFGLNNLDKVIQLDAPRHYYYAQELLKLSAKSENKSILEIGGGFGGLIGLLRDENYTHPYFNIDLAETGLICYYYLKKNKLKVEFLTNNKCDFENDTTYIIPSEIYKSFVFKGVGTVVNFNSFSEMVKTAVDEYISFIKHEIRPDFIFHQNSNYLLFPDSERHIEYLADDFPFDSIYELQSKMISPFHGGSGRYRIYNYKKRK